MNSQPYFPPPDYRPWNHDYYPQPVMDHPPPFAPASEPFPLPNPPISPPPYTDAFTELGITYVKRFILDPPVIYVASTFNGLHLWSYDPHFTQCYELAAPPGRHGKSSFCTSVEGRWPMGGYPEMPLQEQRAPRSLLNPKAIPFYYPAWRSRMTAPCKNVEVTCQGSSWSARMNHSPQSSISSSPDAWPEEMLTPTLQPVAFMVGTNPVYNVMVDSDERHKVVAF
ncbi:hypothetical protein TREMEDRAFT_65348 [Tremella mesenterica DSM 1558]|uniref:uncharacterized protein n=1 Tax=Tremella mesenterica (strain ATCC 24925 / CBS 8224 / DSM 1558 / NBRC 9311 / NRRL Y-6157 / RJB 2259-6 / UBC 559-6) TaxID=578456 RepID=UPI00032C8980|nr:uncharacterized protein TREMEDRAFT_65348 [Tremella mesenterica DSM 1558]EIW66486.1 hypothetical protein TREMEDRAFT_65348 [Tremella mesenterica DSM 1558]